MHPSLPLPWLILLGALTAVGPLSIDMYLPAFPAMLADFRAAPGTLAYTLAAFFIGMAVGQLAYGPVSDRYGRRLPLMVGLALYALASLGCALSASVPALVAWRFLQALGGAAGLVLTRAIVRDRCATREAARAFSLLILVMGLAPILAPLLGGWVAAGLGWRAIFTLLAGYGLVGLIIVWRRLPETHDTRHAAPLRPVRVLTDYLDLLASPSLLGYTLVGGLGFAGMFAYIAGAPFVLIELAGIPAEHFGWVFGLNALGFVAASQINARLLRSRSPTAILAWSVRLPALTGVLLGLCALSGWMPLPLLLAGLFVYVSSLGFIGPNAAAAALATHGQRAGTASALMGALQFALATLFGALEGGLHDGTARPLVLLMAAGGVGAWLVRRHLAAYLHRLGHPEH
ncbi:MAG TPA: multidrug effflux MFS transporter [Thiobacillaceae bacterium]|nr:multidrug effflux MFS transporter [Thiobacillaceae bacterium]